MTTATADRAPAFAELRLWAAALLLGVEDARKGDPEAVAWIGSPDFAETAALAGLDPEAAADAARAAVARGRGEIRATRHSANRPRNLAAAT
ncbi:MAG: hypothetical protein ACQEUZ_07405 [Pseudomonadota bacterium]